MFSLQPFFFFLFLLFTSLISFSTSHVIHLNSDLRSLVYRRLDLPLTILSLFPKGHVTKNDLQIYLENWLRHLKEWDNEVPANIESANKIAQDLGLTGDDQKTSLALSDPPDNTQPAPWAQGLSIVLFDVRGQLIFQQKPILPLLWIFIPDDQAFHFTMLYGKTTTSYPAGSIEFSSKYPLELNMVHLLVPEPDINLLKEGMSVSLDAAYVRHNRDANPKKKSQVNSLTEYKKHDDKLNKFWYKLMYCPWLRNYVKFGKAVLTQLLAEYESELGPLKMMWLEKEDLKILNVVKGWLQQEQLKNDGK